MLGIRKPRRSCLLIAVLLPLCTGCSVLPGRYSFTMISHATPELTVAPVELPNAGNEQVGYVSLAAMPAAQFGPPLATGSVSVPGGTPAVHSPPVQDAAAAKAAPTEIQPLLAWIRKKR